MKINFSKRIKNKAFLLAMASTILLLIQQLGFELPSNIESIINTILTLLVGLGVIIDPTTDGVNDSESIFNINESRE